MNILRLGTRKSALAQAQARWTAKRLHATAFPELQIAELIFITTSGDTLSSSLRYRASRSMGSPAEDAGNDGKKGGLKALFTKEIEEALLERRIDLAVHSLKDMAAVLPKGLVIGAVPEREDPRDVWISKSKRPFRDLSGAKRAHRNRRGSTASCKLRRCFQPLRLIAHPRQCGYALTKTRRRRSRWNRSGDSRA